MTWRRCDMESLYPRRPDAQRPRPGDLALPPPAPGQPGRLAPVGPRGARRGARARRAAAGLDRLLELPLVPRHGARVLRGSRDRRAHERALRQRQGRPRGAAGRRRALHGGGPGDDRVGRLAAQRVHQPRAGAVLRRHVLPARAAPRNAELAPGARRSRGGVGAAPRVDRGAGAADRRAAAGRRAAGAVGEPDHGGVARRRGCAAARDLRRRPRRLGRGAEVPRRERDRVPAAARRARHGAGDTAQDGSRRHLRPGRRWLSPLQRRRALGGPPLREDALRQRAARARLPARVAGVGRGAAAGGRGGDARLGAARDAR